MTTALLIIGSLILMVCAIKFWKWRERKRDEKAIKEAIGRYENRRRCQVCSEVYDKTKSTAPELFRDHHCSDYCYRLEEMIEAVAREGRHKI